MTNSRQKGKRGELYFLNTYLKKYWPETKTNRANQSAEKGCPDYVGLPFACEAKYGKSYGSKMIRKIISQLTSEANNDTLKIALVKPDREEEYMLIPRESIEKILRLIYKETK
jgi:hypothetical protein